MLKLYYANIKQLNNENAFRALYEKVNIQRREKVLRCNNEKDKYRSLLAGYLLREALEQEGICYETVTFEVEKNGKSVIKDISSCHFSLSHAGNYAVCLISDRRIGVDIETASKRIFHQDKQLKNIANKVLSKDEYESFLDCPKEKITEQFLRYWTRKECYSKADGRGLSIGMNQVFTDTDQYYSRWLDEDTYLSIYVEDGIFTDLQMKELCL